MNTPTDKMQYVKRVIDYISHKQHIAQNSIYYSNVKWMDHLGRCWELWKFLKFHARNKSLYEISCLVKMHYKHLEGILPNPNNRSYQSSSVSLTEINQLSTQYINQYRSQLNHSTQCMHSKNSEVKTNSFTSDSSTHATHGSR